MRIWINDSSVVASTKEIEISGVPGTSRAILVEMNNVASGGLLPTGNVVDELDINEGEDIPATLIAGVNPTVIVCPEVLLLKGNENPKHINYEEIAAKIDRIRVAAAKAMRIPISDALRLAWVAAPCTYEDSRTNIVSASDVDILSRITTVKRIHHAHTGTGAINVAAASLIPGTIPFRVRGEGHVIGKGMVRIGHPAGTISVSCDLTYMESIKNWQLRSAGVLRTARCLMSGNIHLD